MKRKILGIGVAVTLIVASITTDVHGQATREDLSVFGGKWRRVTRVVGEVVCVGCALSEVQMAQPGSWQTLHQLTHRLGQVVMQVRAVNDSRIWNVGDLHPQLLVQTEDHLFQQLTAEENLFKEVEILGLLSNTQVLEIFHVIVRPVYAQKGGIWHGRCATR